MKRGPGLAWHWGLALSSEQAAAVKCYGKTLEVPGSELPGMMMMMMMIVIVIVICTEGGHR